MAQIWAESYERDDPACHAFVGLTHVTPAEREAVARMGPPRGLATIEWRGIVLLVARATLETISSCPARIPSNGNSRVPGSRP